MPLIHIHTLPLPTDIDRGEIMGRVIRALAEAIDTPAERIFAGWQTYDLQADGLEVATEFQPASHPPVARIELFTGRTSEKKAAAVTAVAAVLKESLPTSGNPFVHVHDIPSGQVHTGGRLLERN